MTYIILRMYVLYICVYVQYVPECTKFLGTFKTEPQCVCSRLPEPVQLVGLWPDHFLAGTQRKKNHKTSKYFMMIQLSSAYLVLYSDRNHVAII